MQQKEPRDLLAEWLKLSREVLAKYYPDSPYAVLVIERGNNHPSVQLPVTQDVFCDPAIVVAS